MNLVFFKEFGVYIKILYVELRESVEFTLFLGKPSGWVIESGKRPLCELFPPESLVGSEIISIFAPTEEKAFYCASCDDNICIK